MIRVLVVRQDDAWHVLGDHDFAAEVVPSKVPLPESQVPEVGHVRLTTEVSPQELLRLVQEVERVEVAALAAMRGGVPLSGVPGPEPKGPLPESQVPVEALADFQELEKSEFAALAAAQAARRAAGAPPSGPKVPKPEPETPHDIEEVIRREIKATNDVPISVSASSSIVPVVPAGQTLPHTSLPSSMVAAPSLQQPSRRVQHPSGQVFDSRLDLEIGVRVFSKILAGASNPFAGSPDLRPGGIDTSMIPSWLLFGWDHDKAKFGSVYSVMDNPNHGDQGF
jgi:hypothetical protein